MKKNHAALMTATACMSAAALCVAPAFAETTGEQSLTGYAAFDIWKITCPPGSRGLRANVLDLQRINGAAIIGVFIAKDSVANTTDEAEGAPASPFATLDHGAGQYHVIFRNMFGTAADDYVSVIQCRNAVGYPAPSVPGSFRKIYDQ